MLLNRRSCRPGGPARWFRAFGTEERSVGREKCRSATIMRFMQQSSNLARRKYSSSAAPTIPVEVIEHRIFLIRGQKVMLDQDLAELYGVTTGNLNLAVRRNRLRFPDDLVFQLIREETDCLLLQNARAKARGGRRTLIQEGREQYD